MQGLVVIQCQDKCEENIFAQYFVYPGIPAFLGNGALLPRKAINFQTRQAARDLSLPLNPPPGCTRVDVAVAKRMRRFNWVDLCYSVLSRLQLRQQQARGNSEHNDRPNRISASYERAQH